MKTNSTNVLSDPKQKLIFVKYPHNTFCISSISIQDLPVNALQNYDVKLNRFQTVVLHLSVLCF